MATPKTKATPTSLTPSLPQLHSTLTSLQTVTHILAGLTHRNKNQHRGTKWWPSFNMLRRSLQKLILDLEAAIQRAEVLGSSSKSKQQRKTAVNSVVKTTKKQQPELDRVVERAEWMRDVLGPKAYEAFTQLTADRQFAQLGLVLIGVLAQVEAAMAPLVPTAESAPASSSLQGSVVDPAQGTQEADAQKVEAVEKTVGDAGGDLDLGVAIARDALEDQDDVKPSVESMSSPISRVPSAKEVRDLEKTRNKKRKALTTEDDRPRAERPELFPEESKTGEKPKKPKIVGPDPFFQEAKEAKKSKKPRFDDAISRTRDDGPKTTTIAESKPVKKPKKKKKNTKREGGDEFDDLFSSLL